MVIQGSFVWRKAGMAPVPSDQSSAPIPENDENINNYGGLTIQIA